MCAYACRYLSMQIVIASVCMRVWVWLSLVMISLSFHVLEQTPVMRAYMHVHTYPSIYVYASRSVLQLSLEMISLSPRANTGDIYMYTMCIFIYLYVCANMNVLKLSPHANADDTCVCMHACAYMSVSMSASEYERYDYRSLWLAYHHVLVQTFWGCVQSTYRKLISDNNTSPVQNSKIAGCHRHWLVLGSDNLVTSQRGLTLHSTGRYPRFTVDRAV